MSNHEHFLTGEEWKMQSEEDLPRVWELRDPYHYAPRKPDGDTWRIILEPLMKKDKMKCEAWKDEVQNLLIFAGLFSAVVTAFVIESYKNLQPDPIENLILVITNSSATTPPPFSPTTSAIRINIFWFLSLVLSLTTVLVGIVSLQWLREHQSYPDLTPKQTFALFHMRSEGLEKWKVPHILATLPLLLQAALVLFFAGMVDFLFSLQSNVAIPVVIVTGLSSTFLIMTTILPTLQGFPFYFPFLYLGKNPPSQCVYKSPQSQAFRMITKPVFRACSVVLPYLRLLWQKMRFRGQKIFGGHHIMPLITATWSQSTWTQFDLSWLAIRDAYAQGAYDHDAGLPLHRHRWSLDLPLYDTTKGLRKVVQNEGTSALHTDHTLFAVYYSFEEVSLDIMGRSKRWNDSVDPFNDQERRNRYFRWIVEDDGQKPRGRGGATTLSDLVYLNDGRGLRDWEAWEVLHHENMLVFLSQVLHRHPSTTLSAHAMELQMRMIRDLLAKPRKFKKDWNEYPPNNIHVSSSSSLTPILKSPTRLPPSLMMDYTGFKENLLKCANLEDRFAFCYQYASIVKSFFLSVVDAPAIDSEQHRQSFHSHRQMVVFMTEAGWITSYLVGMYARYAVDTPTDSHSNLSTKKASKHSTQARYMINTLISNLEFIAQQLDAEMHEMDGEPMAEVASISPTRSNFATVEQRSSSHHSTPTGSLSSRENYIPWTKAVQDYGHESFSSQNASLFFYVACLYVKALKQQYYEMHSPVRRALENLKPVLRRYYLTRRVIHHDGGSPFRGNTGGAYSSHWTGTIHHACSGNADLEHRWGGMDEDGILRFSEKWWEFLIGGGTGSTAGY